MTELLSQLLGRHLGGLLPLPNAEREVHVFDGVTYTLEVTWLRRRFGLNYHSPNIPRGVRRTRAREMARVHAVAEAAILRSTQNH